MRAKGFNYCVVLFDGEWLLYKRIVIPQNPPNFFIQAELRTYVTPVVILPDELSDTESLADTTTASPATADLVDIGNNHTNGSGSPDVLVQRSVLLILSNYIRTSIVEPC